jgi:hypothetical protein
MSKLSGTWYGTFGWAGASLYTDEGDCILRIKEDGMFTWTVTPSRAANNLAKVWTWSGTAVRSGTRVTFRTSQGPWVTLIRSGNTLYGQPGVDGPREARQSDNIRLEGEMSRFRISVVAGSRNHLWADSLLRDRKARLLRAL